MGYTLTMINETISVKHGLRPTAEEATMAIINNQSKAGELASSKRVFGECSRYAIAPVYTRFDAVSWFVWDAETTDPRTKKPAIIRQESTEQEALRGL